MRILSQDGPRTHMRISFPCPALSPKGPEQSLDGFKDSSEEETPDAALLHSLSFTIFNTLGPAVAYFVNLSTGGYEVSLSLVGTAKNYRKGLF